MVKTLVFRKGNLGKLTSAITIENELISPPFQTPFLAFIRGKAEVGPVFQKLGFLNKVKLKLDRMCTRTWGKLVSFSRCFILFFVAKISNFKSAEKNELQLILNLQQQNISQLQPTGFELHTTSYSDTSTTNWFIPACVNSI